MSVTHVSTSVTTADGSSLSKSVTASIGNAILMAINWNPDVDNRTIGSPQWNGQSMTQLGTTVDTPGGKMALYMVIAAASATANITSTFSDFVFANTSITVASASGGTINATLASVQTFTSGTYSAPSITLTTVPTGALAVSILHGAGRDKDFNDTTAATWTAGGGATNRGAVNNANTWRVNVLTASSQTGAGSNITMSWSASAGQPMYTHWALYLNDAASATLTALSTPVAVGGTGYTGTTSTMGTITSLTFAGKVATITGTSTNNFVWSMPSFQNGVTYPAMGSQTFTAGDGSSTATRSSTVQPMAGYTAVDLVNPVDTGAYSLGKDAAFVNGVVVHLPTAAGTLNTNGTLTDYVFGTYAGWMRDTDGKMYSFTLNVTNSQSVVTFDKIIYTGIKNNLLYNPIQGVIYS